MIPEEAAAFKCKMNEQITVSLEKESIYGVKCMLHCGMGMVPLVAVGRPENLEQAKGAKPSGKAKKVFDELLALVPAGN